MGWKHSLAPTKPRKLVMADSCLRLKVSQSSCGILSAILQEAQRLEGLAPATHPEWQGPEPCMGSASTSHPAAGTVLLAASCALLVCNLPSDRGAQLGNGLVGLSLALVLHHCCHVGRQDEALDLGGQVILQ